MPYLSLEAVCSILTTIATQKQVTPNKIKSKHCDAIEIFTNRTDNKSICYCLQQVNIKDESRFCFAYS